MPNRRVQSCPTQPLTGGDGPRDCYGWERRGRGWAWRFFFPFGWDAKDYLSALQRYPAYVNGQASSSLAYSPLFMIPVLGVARLLPLWLAMATFGLAYFSGWLTQLWAGMQCATPDERKILRYVAPVIAFVRVLLLNEPTTLAHRRRPVSKCIC